MSSRNYRFQQLLLALRRQIDSSLAPGERLPTGRELAAMHGVGLTTIHRALKVLSAEGGVRTAPRAGWFRAATTTKRSVSAHRKKLVVGVLSRHAADDWNKNELYPALLEEARSRRIQVVAVPNPHSYQFTLEQKRIDLARVPWNSFDIGLLVDAQHTLQLRHPALLEHRVLAVDLDATELGIDSVAFADAQGGALAARHLLELGHRRFAVTEERHALGSPHDPAKTARRHGFEMAIGGAGGLLLPQWRLPISGDGRESLAHHMARNMVAAWASAAPAERPTALFAISRAKILDDLARIGLRVPRDLSVLGVTWNGRFFGGHEPVVDGIRYSCLDFDLSALVRRVFDAVVELGEEEPRPGKGPRRPPKLFLAPALLVPGKSTVPPRS